MFTSLNISDREAGFVTQINYDGGKFVIDPRKLAPGETATFDLEKIRDEQMEDNAGHHIPKETSLGQFKWAIHGVTGGKLVLIGRAEMVSRSQHVSTSYSCSEACPPYYGGSVTFPSTIIVNASGTATASMTAYYGSGYSTGPYGVEANWSIDNPIASFNPSESVSATTITGQNPGSGFLLAEMGPQEWYVFDGLECIDNGPYTVEDGGPIEVSDPNRKIVSINQEIIDESTQGQEVVECGRFKIIVRIQVGCPPPDHTLELIGHIQDDATLLSSSEQLINNERDELCTYDVTNLYRMKNRLSQTIGTGFTSYTARLTYRDANVTKAGPGISTRATIPGTGPCP